MTRRAEPCPIDGCIDPKARGHLMCRHHWRLVDAFLRKDVNAAWKAMRDLRRNADSTGLHAAIVTYRVAEAAAIKFITDRKPANVA